MQDRQIIIWAVLTIAIATVLFAAAFQISGHLQARDYLVPYRAVAFLMAIMIQSLWLAAGIFAAVHNRKSILLGMLWGFGCEAVVLLGIVLYSASAHF